jgi:two-component system, OmpR family, phosphate regulon sensor histidine kinase PhoR
LKNKVSPLKSFQSKLILSFVAILAIPFAFIYLNLDKRLQDSALEDIKASLTKQALVIEDLVTADHSLDKGRDVLDTISKSLGARIAARISIIAADGTVLADSDRTQQEIQGMENHAGRPEVITALNDQIGSQVRYSRTLKINMLYIAVPVKDNGSVRAVVRLALPLARVKWILTSTRHTLLISLAFGLTLAFVLGFLLTGSLMRPIKRFIYASGKFSKGEFGHRIYVNSRDELGELGATLNSMAQSIEEKVKEVEVQNQQLRAIFQSMVEGIIVLDNNAVIVAVNPSIERMFGISQPQVRKKMFLEAIPNNDMADIITQVLKGGVVVSRELELVWPVHKTFQINAAPIMGGGAVAGCLIVAHDVTEIRKLEVMRTDFVANASHELKTPLTSIKGFVETLLEGALDDKEHAAHFLKIIQEHADRLNNLINDLLDLSYLESKEVAMQKTPVQLKTLVDNVVSGFTVPLKKKSIDVKNDISPDVSVLIDKAKIEQVITNLIDNAVKFSKEKGRLIISAQQADGKITLWVKDSGAGIPAKDLPRIFERFYRVDKARSREMGGTGLGLAIVKHIVELHGGTVGVESTEGLGSQFWFTLPL